MTNPQPQALESKLDWRLKFFPPLVTAFLVLLSDDPKRTIENNKHSSIWIFFALVVAITLSVITLLSGKYAPWVSPITSVWDYLFKPFITPKIDYGVMSLVALAIFTSSGIAYLICCWIGRKLAGRRKKDVPIATNLAISCAIVSAFVCVASAILIQAIGWAIKAINIYLYVDRWTFFAAIAITSAFALWFPKIFKKAGYTAQTPYFYSWLLASYVAVPSFIGAYIVDGSLSSSMLERGRAINHARQLPIGAVAQVCRPFSQTLTCAITLWPQRWQDFELIGPWKLGTTDTNNKPLIHSTWEPTHLDGKALPVISLEAGKDSTFEINIPLTDACAGSRTRVSDSDGFFFILGRVKGEQRLASIELSVRLDNQNPPFPELLNDACRLESGK